MMNLELSILTLFLVCRIFLLVSYCIFVAYLLFFGCCVFFIHSFIMSAKKSIQVWFFLSKTGQINHFIALTCCLSIESFPQILSRRFPSVNLIEFHGATASVWYRVSSGHGVSSSDRSSLLSFLP